MTVFVVINNAGIMINSDVNVKNWLIKVILGTLIDHTDKGFIWNPSNCECEYDKSCDVGEYLNYEDCKCRKKLVDKLVEECTETVEQVKLAKITLAENENKHKYSLCTLYIVLFSVLFTINIGIATYFV